MIHKFEQAGHFVLLDTNSGGVMEIDKLTFDILDFLCPPIVEICPQNIISSLNKEYNEEEIYQAYNEIYELYKLELIFSEDDYQKFADKMVSSPIKAMCLHIAHDCNLRCEYCFASTGDFGVGRKLMSYETGKKAVDFLLEQSMGRKNLEMDFFGGEPLMNFEVVKQIVSYARSKEQEYNKVFRFTITTNGMLLDDDKIDFINKEMSNVVLSIDGRKEVNDRVRKCVNGSGCFDIIMPKFKKLVEKRGDKDYYVRGTFTKYNLDFSNDVLELNAQGFDQVSVEPVVSESDKAYAITSKDLPKIFEEYENLANKMIELKRENKWFNFFHFMLDFEQGPCAIKRLRGCGCGNEYVAITPDEDIYPCHQFVGKPEWKMGNLNDQSFDFEKKEYFAKANIYKKSDCLNCWAKFYCSGGCNANNLEYEGDILNPHKLSCEMTKKRIECAIITKL
jgi:uncharacterized protein